MVDRDEIIPAINILDNAAVVEENSLLLHLAPQLATSEGCVKYLAARGLLRNRNVCDTCLNPSKLSTHQSSLDGLVWLCRACDVRKSIRQGSFFANSRLTLEQLIAFIYFWCADMPQQTIKWEASIESLDTLVDCNNYMRDLCSFDVRQNFKQLGGFDENGEAIVVEIDESKYFHRKYHRGSNKEGHWVFGAVERGSGKTLLEIVPNRTREVVEPIITKWLLPGTRVVSDGWEAYDRVDTLGGGVYLHDSIGREGRFVDPVHPDIHIQNVLNMWMHAKKKFRSQCGTSPDLLPSYLDEFIWRRNYPEGKAYSAMLNCIRQFYPVD